MIYHETSKRINYNTAIQKFYLSECERSALRDEGVDEPGGWEDPPPQLTS